MRVRLRVRVRVRVRVEGEGEGEGEGDLLEVVLSIVGAAAAHGRGGDVSVCGRSDRNQVGEPESRFQVGSNTTFKYQIPIPLLWNQDFGPYRYDTGKCRTLAYRLSVERRHFLGVPC